jgi:hypothetical protein
VETQSGRKPQNAFSYMSLRITFIGRTNFLCFPAATRRRLRPPSFSGYNLREALTPQFSGYNQKEAPAPYFLRIQPEGSSNSPILWLQLEVGSNPLCSPATTRWKLQLPNSLATNRRRLQAPISPYVLQLQPKGGYNHLSLPHPTALK